jgi:hypothetical protein
MAGRVRLALTSRESTLTGILIIILLLLGLGGSGYGYRKEWGTTAAMSPFVVALMLSVALLFTGLL